VSAPRLSVVIPVRDGARYLRAAVDSVRAQTVRELELIVVDDGSEDATPELIRALDPPVRGVRQEPAGVAAALNRGVELARGDLIAFLDADDLWVPRKTEVQLAALAADPALHMVFGHVRQFPSPELTASERAAIARSPEPMPGLSKGTMLIRREALARVGPFATEWRVGDFVDWHARATELGLKAAMLPDVVMLRRLHGSNNTREAAAAHVDYVRIARAALARRRAAR
jgi:glycosyltransferase involved in cell wall biosynthesis